MIFRQPMRVSLLLTIVSLALATAGAAQKPTTPDVLTLDGAIELARAKNREIRQARLEIDKQREAWAESKTSYYPRFDTYLLATELLTPLDFTIKAGQLGTFPATGPVPA